MIRNEEIVKRITDYEKQKITIKVQQEGMADKWINVHKIQNGLLHLNVFVVSDKFGNVDFNRSMLNDIATTTGSKFLKKDRTNFYEYANYINVMKGYVAFYQVMSLMEKQKASELIAIIEKELNH